MLRSVTDAAAGFLYLTYNVMREPCSRSYAAMGISWRSGILTR
jgi:hypothetical protein